jgi:hypothetical protein
MTMTDIAKAIAFAEECLAYQQPRMYGSCIQDEACITKHFDIMDIGIVLEQFLGNRFFIQINRGTSSLFKWSVIVGLQNRLGGPSMYDHAPADSDDMLDAIFDACVGAVRLYPTA